MIKSRNDVRIVIVGAGIAGLSAASQLLKNGFDQTIILEATERIGGRINSIYFGDVYCEMGAKWIYIDSSKDGTYEMLNQISHFKQKVLKKNGIYCTNDKGETLKQNFQKRMNVKFNDLCFDIANKYRTGVLQDFRNVQSYLNSGTGKAIQSILGSDERKLAFNVFSYRMRKLSGLMGCCLEKVNIEHMIAFNEERTSQVCLPTSMDSIIHNMTSNFDGKHIKVAHPVGFIKWFNKMDSNRQTVTCLDGSQFFADHIICTLPLGVLKNFSNHLFIPTLPQKKCNSINNIGIGCPLKIYIEYKNYIRPWFLANIRPFWHIKDPCKKLVWTKQIIEISKIAASQKVLEIMLGGPFLEEIEKLPESEILLDVTVLLRKCLRNPFIPYPVSLLRSNWCSNACFLGGKPYISTKSTLNDIVELATPLGEPPTLLFAGDATILKGFGSIDGARRSGLREAQRIVEFYNRQE